MVARLLNLGGVYLGQPEELYGPDDYTNPAGYWEFIKIVELNDALLAHFGGSWQNPPADFPNDLAGLEKLAAFRPAALKALHSFEGHTPWGWKDPRSSLTLPFWSQLIPDLKLVICLRNPLNIVQSLVSRQTPVRSGYALIETYYHKLLQAVEQLKLPYIITHYDSYFYDGPAEINRVAEFCELEMSETQLEAACTSIQGQLRRHSASERDLLQSEIAFDGLEFYLELCAQAGPVYQQFRQSQPENSLEAELPLSTAVRQQWSLERLEWALQQLQASQDQVYGLKGQLARQTEQNTSQAAELERRQAHLNYETHQHQIQLNIQAEQLLRLKTFREYIQRLEEDKAENTAYVDKLEQEYATLQTRIGGLETDLHNLRATRTVRASQLAGVIAQQIRARLPGQTKLSLVAAPIPPPPTTNTSADAAKSDLSSQLETPEVISAELPYARLLTQAGAAGQVLHRADIYGSGPPSLEASVEVIKLIERYRPVKVLDIGCGGGAYLRALQERNIPAIGLEVNPAYVSLAQAQGLDARLYEGQKLPFGESEFDTVMAIEVLEHILDWEKTLFEMLRVARRQVVISVPNIGVLPRMYRHLVGPWHLLDATHVNFFTQEILAKRLEQVENVQSEVFTYGETIINKERFHNHIFAVVTKVGPA